MFILKSKHTKIIKEMEEKLKEAQNFKALIERLATPVSFNFGSFEVGSYDPLSSNAEININIKDNVATLVNDELSKDLIIKQKSTKVIFMSKDGGIEKTGFTKQKPDKGYSYKLIRK